MHMQALTRPEVVRLPAANETAPLHLADAAAVAQALAPDLPVHCFSPATLAATARTYLDGFPGEVSYAVKANSGRHVLVTLAEAGIHVFDVASPAEMEAVREVAPTAELHYHNPIKGRREIIAAAEVYGVRRFAADCVAEIDKIAAVLASLGIAVSEAEIAVRFRLPRQGMSAHDFSSKFGVGPDEAAELLRYASGKGFGVVLTFHPGSQCTNPEGYSRHIEAAAVAARTAGVRLAALNVGGGFPARYLDLAAPEPEAYFAAIASKVDFTLNGQLVSAATNGYAASAVQVPAAVGAPGRLANSADLALYLGGWDANIIIGGGQFTPAGVADYLMYSGTYGKYWFDQQAQMRDTINAQDSGSTITANGAGDRISVGIGANTITANGAGDTITVGVRATGGGFGTFQAIHATGVGDTITIATKAADGSAITWANTITIDGGTVGGNTLGIGNNSTVSFGNGIGLETVTVTGALAGATTAGGTSVAGISFITLNNVVVDHHEAIVLNNVGAAGVELTAGVTFGASQVNVAQATSLAQAFDIAAATAGLSQQTAAGTPGVIAAHTGVVDWFQFGGNTYIVEAVNNGITASTHTALAAGDQIIKIAGLVDLSGSLGFTAPHTITF